MRVDTGQGIEAFSFYGARTMITRSKGIKRPISYRAYNDPDSTRKRLKVEKNVKGEKKATVEPEKEKTNGNDYDAIRQRNIAENMAFLQSLKIEGLKLGLVNAVKKGRPPKTTVKEKPKVKAPQAPRRQSLRLQCKFPDTAPLHAIEEKADGVLSIERIGPQDFKKVLESSTEEESFLTNESTRNALKTTLPPLSQESTRNVERCDKAFKKMTLDDTCIEKLTMHRITCMVVHPSKEVTLACAGDKRGYLGFFKLGKGNEENMVETYSPHAGAIMCVKVNRDMPQYIYSSSYDETIRRANIETGIFEEVYRAPVNCGILYFAWDGPSTMTLSYSDGCVSFVDTRTPGAQATRYHVHDHRVRTVDVHPAQSQYFVTASTDRTVKIWDRRKMSKRTPEPITMLKHQRSCASAFFSSLTGNKIVTTSSDNGLRVFNSGGLTGEVKLSTKIKHNNEVGRWLTPFRAVWVPQSDDIFLVGSMSHPRCIEAFASHGLLMHTFTGESLNSVCSIVDMHPERYILAGGNSSGRVFVFKDT